MQPTDMESHVNVGSRVNYSLSKSKEETFPASASIDALPRAVLRHNANLLLDGDWSFSLDLHDRGLQESWHLGHHYQEKAPWPGSVEEHMKSTNGKKAPRLEKVIVWYEREFPLPERENHSPKSMLQLTFGACGYETRVWLNGFPLVTIENELIHHGEYTSFSYELDPVMLKPANRLTVRIADSMEADIPRGKQASHIYKRGGIWYQTYSGPVRSIWLEEIERNRLRSRVSVVSIVEDRLVRFNLTLHIHDPGTYTVKLQVYLPGDPSEAPIATDHYTMALEAGEKNQRLVLDIPEAQLWSYQHPQLYKLVATLTDEEGYSSMIETHFGLRKIESRGCKIYLNNNPIYLDGILYQPGASTYEEIKKHLHAIKKLGCNLVRIHIAGVDPRIYKLADKIGLMLWVEVPSPHRSSQVSRINHRQELQRMLSLLETHPSIVIWSLYNEGWGAQDIATNKETRQYIIDLYNYMRINHPQFLVVDNDGWNHISYQGRLKSDILTA
ncbi:MAG TPA: glycoside hydrolase family 2 TIM barrel-domain containing protein, partial [Sphingobacteriaceae bacterium]